MSDRRGKRYDRNYVITHNWLGVWESTCDRCGEFREGSLTKVFSLVWAHRKCGDDDE